MIISEKKDENIMFERLSTITSNDNFGIEIGIRQRNVDQNMFESPIQYIDQLNKRYQGSQPDLQIQKPNQNQIKVTQMCHYKHQKKIQQLEDENEDQSSFDLSKEPKHWTGNSIKAKLKYKNTNQQIWKKFIKVFKPLENLQQYFHSQRGPNHKIEALLKQPNFKQKLKQIFDNGDVLEKLKKSKKVKQSNKIKNIKAYQKLKQKFLKLDPLIGSKLQTQV